MEVVEFLGNDAHIHVSSGGHELVATISSREPLAVGDNVVLHPSQMYLFDPASGAAIAGG